LSTWNIFRSSSKKFSSWKVHSLTNFPEVFKVSNLSGVFWKKFQIGHLFTRANFSKMIWKFSEVLESFTHQLTKFLKHFEDFSSSRKKFQTENVYSLTKLSQTLLQLFASSLKVSSWKVHSFSKFRRIIFSNWKLRPLTKFPNVLKDFSSSQKKFQTEKVHPSTKVFFSIICKSTRSRKFSPN
jgi:hypothetical protein